MANSPQARKRARQETQHRARNMAQRAAIATVFTGSAATEFVEEPSVLTCNSTNHLVPGGITLKSNNIL